MTIVGIVICLFITIISLLALHRSHGPDFPGLVHDAVAQTGKIPTKKELNDGIVMARGIILVIGVLSLLCSLVLITK